MALLLETTNARGQSVRLPIEVGRNRFPVEPGMKYRIIDDGQRDKAIEGRAKRIGNDLVVEDLPGDRVVEFESFFTRCSPSQSCALLTDTLGGAAGSEITPATEPIAALTDGNFLMYSSSGVPAESLTPMASEGMGMGVKLAGLGLVAVGLAAAGGGGGGGGGDDPGPTAPQVPGTVTSPGATNQPHPILSGKATAGTQVAISISGDGITTISYNTTADADGNWTINTATARTSSAAVMPPDGLPEGNYTITVRTVDANNAPVDTTSTLAIDTSTTVPVIHAVATDNLVNGAEKAAGVAVSGTAEAGTTVVVTWGTSTQQATTAADGSWTVQFAPDQVPADGTTTLTATARDGFGNTASANDTVVIATSHPAVLITNNLPAGREVANASPVTFTIAFSEAVTGFDAGDVRVTGGTMSGFQAVAGSPNTYSVVVTPTSGVASGTVRVEVPAGAANSAANGNATAGFVASLPYDTQPPGAAVSDNVSGSTTNGPVTFTFTFTEAVTGFTASDISIAGGSVVSNSFSGASGGRVYTIQATPNSGTQSGTLTASVAAGSATDLAGNSGPGSAVSGSQSYDTAAPTVSIDRASGSGTVTGAVAYTFTFSEPVANFSQSDVSVINGTVTGFSQVSSSVYSATITPAPSSQGAITVGVGSGTFTDTAGNYNSGAASNSSVSYDTRPGPTLQISDNIPDAYAHGPVTFTFEFSAAVTGFTAADIAVSGGTVTTALSGTGATYQMTVTPTAGSEGVSVTVAANSVSLSSGAAPGPTSPVVHTQPVDNVAPTVTISDNQSAPVTNQPTTFTFAFNEAIADGTFTLSDITYSGGSPGSLVRVNASTYSLTLTPDPGVNSGIMSVSLGANSLTDAHGMPGPVATATGSQNYDTLAPVQNSVTASGGNGSVTLTLGTVLDTGDTAVWYRSDSVTPVTLSRVGTTSSFEDRPPAGVGDYSYHVVVTDAAGNSSLASLESNTVHYIP